MAILDDILINKKANSVLPIDVQSEVEKETPSVAEIKNTQPSQNNIQDQQSSNQLEVKYPNKPQGLQDNEYEHLLKFYSPEAINKFTAPFDPTSEGSYLQSLYETSVPKPSAPDEKKLRNAQLIASIADGVGLLSQMFTYNKGAHVNERNAKESALSQVNNRAKELQDRYLQLSMRYDDGLFNARLKDFQQTLNEYNNGKKGIQSVLAQKQKLDEAARQADNKIQYNFTKMAQDQANKDRDYEYKKSNQESIDKHRKALQAQGWSRVTDSRNRASAYIKSVGGKGNSYQMIFEANPNDSDVHTDNFGNKIKVYEMSKGEIDQYARQALNDKDFLNKYPQFNRKPGLLGEAPKSFTEKERTDIAAAYMQELYEQNFNETRNNSLIGPEPMQEDNYDNEESIDDDLGQFSISRF